MTFGWLVRVVKLVKLEVASENGDYIVQRLDKGVVAQRLSRARRDGEKKWGPAHHVAGEEERGGGSGECRAGLKAASSCAGAAETGGDQ
jgi:hypothetical protein